MTATGRCPGCGLVDAATVPPEAPTDPYGGASAGCMLGDLSASHGARLRRVPISGRSPVDRRRLHGSTSRYATPAGRRSVAVHLVGLCLVVDRGLDEASVRRIMAAVFPADRTSRRWHPSRRSVSSPSRRFSTRPISKRTARAPGRGPRRSGGPGPPSTNASASGPTRPRRALSLVAERSSTAVRGRHWVGVDPTVRPSP